jgi:hypothetical protein
LREFNHVSFKVLLPRETLPMVVSESPEAAAFRKRLPQLHNPLERWTLKEEW